MRIVYDDEAFEEAINAAAYYEARSDGLARRFLTAWQEAESRMIADPERNRVFENGLRRCRFRVFPYTLIYRIAGQAVEVIAVMHQHREPGYWRDQTEP